MKQRLLDYKLSYPDTWAKIFLDVDLKKDLLLYKEFVDLPIEEKAAAIILGHVPKCECGNAVKYSSKIKSGSRGTPYGGWLDFCSRLCMQKSSSTIEKRKNTNLKRYGSDSWAKSKVGKLALSQTWSEESKAKYNESYKKTCIEKYGVDHYTQTDEYLEKRSNTILEKTEGKFTNYFQDTDKLKEANLKRYGVDCWAKTDESRKFKSENNSMKDPAIALKSKLIRMTNSERYDEHLLNILLTTDEDGFKKYINNLHIEKSLNFRQEFARELGISTCFLNSLFRKFGMSNEFLSLGTSKSYAEETVFKYLDSIGLTIKRSDRTILEGREIDLLIEDKKVGIEFDGIRYHSENYGGKDKNYHLSKTAMAEDKGYQLLHIFENEWNDINKKAIWMSIIKAKCGLITSKIYARKCTVLSIKAKEAREFLVKNHLSGFVAAKEYLGLFHENELVSVLSYGKSRFSKNENEIYRFATKLDTIVVGGLSKLLSRVEGDNLVTYADRRFSGKNSAYSKIFNLVGATAPGWYGFDTGDYELRHRMNFTKKKLKEILENEYDDSKSAVENMFCNDMDRIFDCGHWKYAR